MRGRGRGKVRGRGSTGAAAAEHLRRAVAVVGSQAVELGARAVVDVQVLVLRCREPARARGSARDGLGARLGPGLGLG